MENTIYTIGYTAFEQNTFLNVLKQLGITCLVDVRSIPSSSYSPQYNKAVLESILKKEGIRYRNYLEFGARQDDKKYYTDSGYLDFEKYVQSDAFLNGMSKLHAGMEMGFRFVLMCAEKNPINCHRSIMVTRAFSDKGYDVQHICADKNGGFYLQTQKELEMRLVQLNGDDLDQISLFDTNEDRIQKAYQRQNREIAFRLEDE